MKIAKKLLSIALTFALVLSVASVAAITASADGELIYDSNVAISYDPWSRDYAYGTGISANAPRKITYNDDGWMRVQSQTEDDIVNEGEIVSKQWQYKLDSNPQLAKQFENACFDDASENFYFYSFIKSTKFIIDGKETSNPVNLQAEIALTYTYDGEKGNLIWSAAYVLNKNYGFRYVSTSKAIPDELKDASNIKLTSVSINVQDYGASGKDSGLAELDCYIAPIYTKQIPGTMYTISEKVENLDAANDIEQSSFIYNNTTDVFDPEDFQWEYAYGEEPIKDGEDKNSIYKRGRVKRYDETAGENYDLGYPVLANGSSKTYIPYTIHADLPATAVANFKNTAVSGDSATFTWTHAGGADAKVYYVVCTNTADKKDKKIVKVSATDESGKVVTTATVTGLTKGATYNAFVIGYNLANLTDGNSNSVTVTIGATVAKPAKPVIKSVAYSAKNQIKITWNKASGATSYDVYRGSKKIKTVTGTSYKDTVKTAGTVKYIVAAKNAGGTTKSAEKSIKTMSFSAKATVKGTPAKKAVTVKITKKVKNAGGYEYSISLKKNMKSAKTKKTNKASFKFTKLKSKKVYYVRVRAYKKVGSKYIWGAYSKTVKVKKTK